MDHRIQTYLDRREFYKKQELLQQMELGNLLLQALEAPFPEHVRPAKAKDIIPGAVIWYKAGDDDPSEFIISHTNVFEYVTQNTFKGEGRKGIKFYMMYDAFIEVTK